MKNYHVKTDSVSGSIKVTDDGYIKFAPKTLQIFVGKPLKSLESWLKQFHPDEFKIEEINNVKNT